MANVVTPPFRVSYPNVFKAKKNNLSGKDEFSLTALFPKDADLSDLKKAAADAIIDKFGADKGKWPKNMRSPFRDQSEKEYENDEGKKVMPAAHEKGAIFLNLKSQQKPGVVDQNVQPIMDETEFYPGCWARASVRAYAYDQAGNRGVSFGLVHVQKVEDDEPLSGRSKPESDFAPIEGVKSTSASKDATSLFS